VTETQTTGPPGLEQVYREHRVPLLRLAFLLTGSREHSEDVVHSAFTSAMSRWELIEQPLPYLKRAIINLGPSVRAVRIVDQERGSAF